MAMIVLGCGNLMNKRGINNEMVKLCKDKKVKEPTYKNHTLVSSYGKAVEIGDCPIIIGERINPTGKKGLTF